jgi:prephenate dehydrogenase
MRPDSLAILGLGAVGSTLARHAIGAGVSRVVGFSGSRGEGVRALKTNAVHHLAERLEEGVRDAEVVIIAQSLPVATLTVGRVASAARKDAWITTIGSLASPLAVAARGAGLESRWAASHQLGLPDIGAGRDPDPKVLPETIVYVSPAGPEGEVAGREVMDLWETVFDAHPVLISPAEHDQRIGWLVQLPVALAAVVGDAYAREALGAVVWGTEAREATDFEGDPAGQAAALLANREVLLKALTGLAASVDGVRAVLAAGDLAAMTRLLEEGRRLRRGSTR